MRKLNAKWMKVAGVACSFALLLGLSACSSGEDLAPPEIVEDSFELLTADEEGDYTRNALEEGAQVPGDVRISVQIDDDQALDWMYVVLNTDEVPLPGRANIFPQSVLDTFPVRGNSIITAKSLVLPNSLAAGTYSLSLEVADEVGNRTGLGPFTLSVENILPLITLDSPTQDSLNISAGSDLRLIGQVQAKSRFNFDFVFSNLDTTFFLLQEQERPQLYSFDQTFSLPDTLSGLYTLTIIATDTAGSRGELPVRLQVQN